MKIGLRELDAGALFVPSLMLPCQQPSGHPWTPERRLALAVLEEALTTIFRTLRVVSEPAVRQRDDARRWVNADEMGWPFSFVNICDVVQFEATSLRAAINLAFRTGKRINTRQWKRGGVGEDGGGSHTQSPERRVEIARLGFRAARLSQRKRIARSLK